jgi:hypothetical protein
MEKKDYCTQNDGDCETCSLANYGKDCMNNPIEKKLKTIKVDYETWKALRRLSVETEKSIGNLIKEKFQEEKENE